jgi:hypothetical protein
VLDRLLGIESMRTLPVKYSIGPLVEGCEPVRLMYISSPLFGIEHYHYYLLQRWLIRTAHIRWQPPDLEYNKKGKARSEPPCHVTVI